MVRHRCVTCVSKICLVYLFEHRVRFTAQALYRIRRSGRADKRKFSSKTMRNLATSQGWLRQRRRDKSRAKEVGPCWFPIGETNPCCQWMSSWRFQLCRFQLISPIASSAEQLDAAHRCSENTGKRITKLRKGKCKKASSAAIFEGGSAKRESERSCTKNKILVLLSPQSTHYPFQTVILSILAAIFFGLTMKTSYDMRKKRIHDNAIRDTLTELSEMALYKRYIIRDCLEWLSKGHSSCA